MEELTNLVRLMFESFPPSVFLGLGVWIGSAIIQTILISKEKIYTRGKKRIRAAVEAGHVVQAFLKARSTNIYHGNGNGNRQVTHFADYTYVVNGKTYNKSLRSNSKKFSNTITLYYFYRPSNAKTASELTFWDERILPMIVPLLLGVLTILVAGYPIQ